MTSADDPVQQRLAALEQQVSRLSGLVDHLYVSLGVRADGPAPADPRFDPRVQQAVQDGNLIEAIKTYRALTGVGLREAKDAIDSLAR
jgi:ribosomal protein L7/L12